MKTLKDLGEFHLVEGLLKQIYLPDSKLLVKPGDDAAVWQVSPEKALVYTVDALVESVHFTRKTITPWQLGWKSVAVNLSDIAAMGGNPIAILVSLALPAETEIEWIDKVYRGIKDICDLYEVEVIGGDVCGSRTNIFISITAIGEVHPNHVKTRSGAEEGDKVLVTGFLGDSALGLQALMREMPDETTKYAIQSHLEPVPRITEGRFLSRFQQVSTMMDLSDGLAFDLNRLVKMSGVGANIEKSRIPINPDSAVVASVLKADLLELACTGGEDYELIITCREHGVEELLKEWKKTSDLPLTVIGEITAQSEGCMISDENGLSRSFQANGFDHF